MPKRILGWIHNIAYHDTTSDKVRELRFASADEWRAIKSLHAPKYRILMRTTKLLEPGGSKRRPLIHRIDIDHIHRSRKLTQRGLKVPNNFPQPRLRQRIEKINNQWFSGKHEPRRIPVDQFDPAIVRNVSCGNLVQISQQLNPNNP